MIMEYYRVTASNSDLIAAPSRLAAIPYAGRLVIEMQSENNEAGNYFIFDVQLPDGTNPVSNMRIPEGATAGGMNADDKYTISFNVPQGGHVTYALTMVGTAVVHVRFTLMP